jgi:ureidoglycolate amidohydrolase
MSLAIKRERVLSEIRLLSGILSGGAARKLADHDDATLDEVRRGTGLAGELEQVRLPGGYHEAFIELHIEQGPLLEFRSATSW